MNENHFTGFKVENFKRFKSLELKDLSQFNLIVGDNNVGKTSLLEALLFDTSGDKTKQNLLFTLHYRNIGNQISSSDLSLFSNKETEQNPDKLSISFKPDFHERDLYSDNILKTGKFTLFFDSYFRLIWEDPYGNKRDLGYTSENSQVFRDLKSRVPYIPFGFMGEDLTIVYSTYLQDNRAKKKKIIKAAQIILPDLEDFEIRIRRDGKPEILIHRKEKNASVPLLMFGDGTIKLFRILFDAIVFEKGRLMIDEIDAGLHHSKMKEFWKVLINIFKELDIQLFATTHNLEFLKYYSEALKELKLENSSRVISLSENFKTKEVNAFTLTFSEFSSALEIGNDIR